MSYNLTPQLSSPQDPSTNANSYITQAPNISTSFLYDSTKILFNPIPPTLIPSGSSHDYSSVHSPRITSKDTYPISARPTQTKPYQPQSQQVSPYSSYAPDNCTLSPATHDTVVGGTTYHDVFSTTPVQPHYSLNELLYHWLPNLDRDLKLLLGTHYCNSCGRSFRRPYLLTDHMRTHTGEPMSSE